MENEIKLHNRDGVSTKLVLLHDNIYKLEQEGNRPYQVTGTMDDIKAIDPSGGPYICIGCKIENYVVTEIKYNHGITIKLEENN